MSLEGTGDLGQDAGAVTVVGVENGDHLTGGHAGAFIHGVVVALILFGNPEEARVAPENVQRTVS